MADQNGFDDIRAILTEITQIQRRQAAVLLTHSEAIVKHDEAIAKHDEAIQFLDERLDRIGRHLEVLIAVVDDMIRKKP